MENAMSKQAVAEREQKNEVVTMTDSASLMAVITRAASDPTIDVEKIERLTGLYERITARQAEQAYNEAMVAAQTEMEPVRQNASNPQTRSKYASFTALDSAIRPIYTKHGFSLSFDTGDCPQENHVRVICKVSCRGHSERPHLDIPADGKGAKGGDVMTKTHATMSAVSYGKRGLMKMIFNIAESGKDDDDGNGAGLTDKLKPEQVFELQEALKAKGAAEDAFLKWAKVEKFEDIPAAYYESCAAAIANYVVPKKQK